MKSRIILSIYFSINSGKRKMLCCFMKNKIILFFFANLLPKREFDIQLLEEGLRMLVFTAIVQFRLHPSIFYTHFLLHSGWWGPLEPIPAVMGWGRVTPWSSSDSFQIILRWQKRHTHRDFWACRTGKPGNYFFLSTESCVCLCNTQWILFCHGEFQMKQIK